MTVRYLPALLASAAVVLVLAPTEAAAQMTMGPGVRTEMTPSAREAHNGVFDHIKHGLGFGSRKASVTVGDVQPVTRLTPEDAAAGNYSPLARPYSTDPPPAAEARRVRPAEAGPPQRIEKTPAPPTGPKDDPRGVEERKDPGG